MVKTIDSKDVQILRVIQAEGRIPVVELAERVNLTKTPCLQRLRRLEKDGYIKEYRAILNPAKIERGYLVYVQVKLENTASKSLASFNSAVKDIPEIIACHMMSGGYDYLLKVRTKDMEQFREIIGDVISSLPVVHSTSTFPVMEEVKDTTVLPITLDQ